MAAAVTVRPYVGPADLGPVLDLLVACRRAGCLDAWPTVAILRRLLHDPAPDWEHDTRLWEEAGAIAAFAFLWEPHHNLVFLVAPRQDAGEGLSAAVLEWATARAGEIGQRAGTPVELSVRAREDDAAHIALLECHGFVAQDWHTVRLARRLNEPLPNAGIPPGFVVRHVAGEHEAPEYVALYRDAMDARAATVEWRLSVIREPEYDPELDLVAVAPDGTWAALCKGIVDREESARLGTVQGWTDPIGTRPAFRRLGLARALLLDGCRRLHERGVEVALIGTGSWNTATLALCEAVGYRPLYRVLSYSRPV